MSCIIPSYVNLDRLAAASGIQMVANGFILLTMGSSMGKKILSIFITKISIQTDFFLQVYFVIYLAAIRYV